MDKRNLPSHEQERTGRKSDTSISTLIEIKLCIVSLFLALWLPHPAQDPKIRAGQLLDRILYTRMSDGEYKSWLVELWRLPAEYKPIIWDALKANLTNEQASDIRRDFLNVGNEECNKMLAHRFDKAYDNKGKPR